MDPSAVRFSFEGADAYHLQGDHAFETPELLEAREQLRNSPKLRIAALQFWMSLGKSIDEHMTRDEYCRLHRLITMVLAPELTEAEAAEAADEDYEDDLDGGDTMTLSRYLDGLCGIADVWTSELTELDYVVFVNKLYRRITRRRAAAAPSSSLDLASVARLAIDRALDGGSAAPAAEAKAAGGGGGGWSGRRSARRSGANANASATSGWRRRTRDAPPTTRRRRGAPRRRRRGAGRRRGSRGRRRRRRRRPTTPRRRRRRSGRACSRGS